MHKGTSGVMVGDVWRIENTLSEGGFDLHNLGEWITTVPLPSIPIREHCDNLHLSILIIFSAFTVSYNFFLFSLKHIHFVWV